MVLLMSVLPYFRVRDAIDETLIVFDVGYDLGQLVERAVIHSQQSVASRASTSMRISLCASALTLWKDSRSTAVP